MLPIRALSLSLFIAVAVGGEADPWLTFSVPDGTKTAERYNASVYGKVFNSPEFAPLKAKWVAAMAEAESQVKTNGDGATFLDELKTAGLSPFDFITQLRFMDGVVQGEVAGKDGVLVPGFRCAFDLGEKISTVVAKKFASEVEKKTVNALSVPGADEAFIKTQDGNPLAARFLRFGTQWVVTDTDRADWQKAVTPPTGANDLVAHFYPVLCALSLDKIIPEDKRADAAEALHWMREQKGSVDIESDFIPAGLRTHISSPGSSLGCAAVDKETLAKLPANTLSAIAIGLDGAAWWANERQESFKRIGSMRHPAVSGEQIEQEFSEGLKTAGLTTSAADLISGIKGTALFALMQSAPFPTAVIAVPRSTGMDEVVAMMLKNMEQEIPEEGASIMIPIPMMPISLSVVRTAKHWLLTTDTMLGTAWVGTTPGGWLETPTGKLAIEKAGADAWLIGAADNAAEIRMYTGFLAMGIQNIPNLNAEERQSVMKTMQVLAKNALPGWCVGHSRDGRTDFEVAGLTGGLALPAIAAAVIIPRMIQKHNVSNPDAASEDFPEVRVNEPVDIPDPQPAPPEADPAAEPAVIVP